MSDYIYPFDPTGKATSNLIQNERQTISPPNWTDYYFIVPKLAPFFSDTLRVIHRPSGKILAEGQDYHCTHWFHDASHNTANRIYGSITILDKTLTGILELRYQTVGGEWVINDDEITHILANTLSNPRITTWEEVVEMPYAFPPIDHIWDLEDLRGADDVVNSLDEIAEVLRQSSATTLNDHINNKDNPHNVTKAQVGLGSVQNYGMATSADASQAESNVKYMTPLRTKELIDVNFKPMIDGHIGDVTNPHNVSKYQVGLGNVQNYPPSTLEDVEIGDSNSSYMTPLRVKQAISKYDIDVVQNHISDVENPHEVTKVQVGLGSVLDYGIATTAEAEAGISNVKYMTPLRTSQAINTIVKDTLDVHVNDKTNPHNVTKAQVGLNNVPNYPIATQLDAREGTSNTTFMTPLRTREAIEFISGVITGSHVGDKTNPHNVTKAQVGLGSVQNYGVASLVEAVDGGSNSLYMTPLLVKEAISEQVGFDLSTHVSDLDNPHEVTKAQVGLGSVQNYGVASTAEAIAGTSNVKYMTPLKVAEAVADVLNKDIMPILDNKLGKAETAVNSGMLSGLSLDEVVEYAKGGGAYLIPGYEEVADDTVAKWTLLVSVTPDLSGTFGSTSLSAILSRTNRFLPGDRKSNQILLNVSPYDEGSNAVVLDGSVGQNKLHYRLNDTNIGTAEEPDIVRRLEVWLEHYGDRGRITVTPLDKSLPAELNFDLQNTVEVMPNNLITIPFKTMAFQEDLGVINGGSF